MISFLYFCKEITTFMIIGADMHITTYTIAEHLPRLILGEHEGRVCLCDWDLPERQRLWVRQIKRYLANTTQNTQTQTTPSTTIYTIPSITNTEPLITNTEHPIANTEHSETYTTPSLNPTISLLMEYNTPTSHLFVAESTPLLEEVKAYLDAYNGGHQGPCDVPMMLLGTVFQQTVWQALRTIPYGTTLTYQQFAQRLHHASAVRAIAHAIGQNMLSILLPCHRVIGGHGHLTGYAGGLTAKTYLLQIEQSSKSQ